MSRRMIAAAILLLGGCTAPRPSILSGPDPSDPGTVSRDAGSAPVGAGIGVVFPVTPLPWESVNRRVAPGAERAP